MISRIICGALCLGLSLTSLAQNNNTYARWQIKPAVGVHIPITRLPSNGVLDNLLQYSDDAYYLQLISATYFYRPNWGVDLTYQGGHSRNISGRAERFNQSMIDEYQENYFVTPRNGAQFDNTTLVGGSIQKGYLGLVYRYAQPKYIIMPKFSIGVTSFYTDWGDAILKEKGTNYTFEVSYSPEELPKDFFTLAPSVIFGYRISKNIIVHTDILYSIYRANINYTKTIRNNFTKEIIAEDYHYKKFMHTLTTGIGVIIELKPVSNNASSKLELP